MLGATARHRIERSTERRLEIVEATKRAAEIHLDEVEAATAEDMSAVLEPGNPRIVASPLPVEA